jgi:hypothetical protein
LSFGAIFQELAEILPPPFNGPAVEVVKCFKLLTRVIGAPNNCIDFARLVAILVSFVAQLPIYHLWYAATSQPATTNAANASNEDAYDDDDQQQSLATNSTVDDRIHKKRQEVEDLVAKLHHFTRTHMIDTLQQFVIEPADLLDYEACLERIVAWYRKAAPATRILTPEGHKNHHTKILNPLYHFCILNKQIGLFAHKFDELLKSFVTDSDSLEKLRKCQQAIHEVDDARLHHRLLAVLRGWKKELQKVDHKASINEFEKSVTDAELELTKVPDETVEGEKKRFAKLKEMVDELIQVSKITLEYSQLTAQNATNHRANNY